ASTRLSERTHQEYAGLVARYVASEIGKHAMDKLTAFSFQSFYNGLSRRGLSARTVKSVHVVLNQAMKSAVKLRMLSYNPCRDCDLPKHKELNINRAMDLEQAHAFIAASYQQSRGVVFRTALELGIRPQELCALQWPDLNWDTAELSITKAMKWPKGGGWKFGPTKTALSRRKLVVTPTLIEDLKRHRSEQLQHRLYLGPDWKGGDHDFIFTNTQGGPLNINSLHQSFKELLKVAGLPSSFRPYDLRHSAATIMLQGNTPPKVAADRLGHSTTRLTLDTYSHVMPSMQRDVADKFESLLHSRPGHVPDTETTSSIRLSKKKRPRGTLHSLKRSGFEELGPVSDSQG
ncbi:hypothetical protein ABS71_16125, partial [bacterium SCN 62-11]